MEVMDQRRNEIVEFVNENKTVTFTQLKEKFPSVSEMTLRTDLKYLDQVKRIVRIHGGAKSMDVVSGNDDVLKLRYGRNANEKKEIAQKALSFVEPAKTIFVDSGSTTTLLAHVLNNQNNIFYTSGLTCAIEMAKLSKSKFIVLPLEKPCNIRRFRLSNPQTVCTFPCFFPYGLKQGKDFYSPLTTLSSSRAELRFASLVEWA